MEWQRLEQLRELVQHEEEFEKIWKFFFDHLGENEEFVQAGTLAPAKMQEDLTPILENIYKRMANTDVLILQLLLTEVPEQHFYHGPCVTDAGLSCVLYFSDLKMGMVSLAPTQGTNLVHYARFTTIPVSDKHFTITPPKYERSH